MKFVTTIFAARQFVSHGHIKVNGKKVTIPSYSLKDGDVVEVKEKSKEVPIVLEAISSTERDTPEYLSVDYDKMKGTFLKGPKPDEVPYPCGYGTKPGYRILFKIKLYCHFRIFF